MNQKKVNRQDLSIPVITIDGGAATGKGTVRALVAAIMGFHQLDSGALYRAVGYQCIKTGVLNTPMLWKAVASTIDIGYRDERIFVQGLDVTDAIRSEEVGHVASIISQDPHVRGELREFQLSMRKHPGLVADGRDQAFIFETMFRFFLIASPEEKARRRMFQLKERGSSVEYERVLTGIIARDRADAKRSVSPLRPHPEARIIDTDFLRPDDVAHQIVKVVRLDL